jgi:hypothetical protein
MTLTLILMGFDGPLPDSHGPLGVGLRDAPPRGLMQRGSQWLAANYTMSSLRTETLKIYDSDALRCIEMRILQS